MKKICRTVILSLLGLGVSVFSLGLGFLCLYLVLANPLGFLPFQASLNMVLSITLLTCGMYLSSFGFYLLFLAVIALTKDLEEPEK